MVKFVIMHKRRQLQFHRVDRSRGAQLSKRPVKALLQAKFLLLATGTYFSLKKLLRNSSPFGIKLDFDICFFLFFYFEKQNLL